MHILFLKPINPIYQDNHHNINILNCEIADDTSILIFSIINYILIISLKR